MTCQAHQVCGISYDGGYGEYMLAPESALALIPHELSAVQAAPLLCAGITMFNALRNTKALAGDNVVVLGVGGLGHLGIQFAHKMGFRTIAVSSGNSKKDLSLKLGADVYIDSSAGNVVQELSKLGGARVILATATNSKAISDIAPALTINGNLVVLAAEPEPLQISPLLLIGKRATISGWPSGVAVDSQDTMNFCALRNVSAMIEEVSLDNIQQGFDKMLSGAARFRVVLNRLVNVRDAEPHVIQPDDPTVWRLVLGNGTDRQSNQRAGSE